MAVAETLSHLKHLRFGGQVEQNVLQMGLFSNEDRNRRLNRA